MSNTDWREVLVRYMRHVGECEGVYFSEYTDNILGSFEELVDKETWQQVVKDASK